MAYKYSTSNGLSRVKYEYDRRQTSRQTTDHAAEKGVAVGEVVRMNDIFCVTQAERAGQSHIRC